VIFRSATEPFDTGTPAGRMTVQMLGVFAEFAPGRSKVSAWPAPRIVSKRW
jgi:hypothetical protein